MSILQPGMVLPDGVITREIGKGGFGMVYEVQTDSGPMAYKVYHGTQLHDRQKLKAFRRGFSATERLDHPNVVKVHQYTYAPVGFYMQYIESPNFRDAWIDEPKAMMNLLHAIAQTLEHAHLQDVIHRDIKPENILVKGFDSDRPVPYLTDFDLAWYSMATVYSAVSESTAAFGHYLYAAPEQYERPEAEITRKPTADIYGFKVDRFVKTQNEKI